MSTFSLSVLTPEGGKFSGAVESLIAPGRDGEFGVLAYHAPMVAALKRGVLRVKVSERTTCFVVGEGVLEVSDGKVVVLCDSLTQASSFEDAQAQIGKAGSA